MNRAREKILSDLEKKDYRALFMEGACQFYALILHDELRLPLFYMCFPDKNVHSHVFVMKERVCFDYEGKKELAVVAETYGGWADELPRPVTPEEIRKQNQRKGIGELESQLLTEARGEFVKRRHLYE